MYDMAKTAERINSAASAKAVTVASILRKLELNKDAVTTMRAGKAPSAVTLARIADELDVSLDYLMGRTDDPTAHR